MWKVMTQNAKSVAIAIARPHSLHGVFNCDDNKHSLFSLRRSVATSLIACQN